MEKNLFVATTNPGKIKEIAAILGKLPINLHNPVDLGITINVVEDGFNYEKNALLKAHAYAEVSHMVTLADDSGLEVEVLNGLPGLHSHRFSPSPFAGDADRRKLLIKKLLNFPRPWKARFICKVVLYKENENPIITSGICKGEIISEERGENGFGYDPIFYIPAVKKTMAELSLNQKNNVSHRAKALRKIIPYIIDLFEMKNIYYPN